MLSAMKAAAQFDGTYSLSEIAAPVAIPEGTLFRWRWQGRLLTAYDFLVDQDLSRRIMTAAAFGRELSGALPDARFDLEDCTRLRVVGSLGLAGFDRQKLLNCLAWPWALPTEVSGDGHSPRYPRVMPQTLAIISTRENPAGIVRHVFDSQAEAFAACKGFAFSVVVDIGSIRQQMRRELATVELERERKAEQYAREAVAKKRAREFQAEEQPV
jgi:hypothetical protein